jgi:hypothetical protein
MSAVAGQFVKFDAIPTRKVVRVVLEMPIEQANDVLAKLGGYPDAANAKWVGAALLDGEPSENTLKGGKIAQRAGILCHEGAFKRFAEHAGYPDPVKLIYDRCGITSRAHLDHDAEAAKQFHEIELEYSAWRNVA